jgi:hypothetical protein
LRHSEQVALVRRRAAPENAPIEAQPVFKQVLIEPADGNRQMMPSAVQIRNAQIDGPDFFFAAESEDFARGHGGTFLRRTTIVKRCAVSAEGAFNTSVNN